MIEPHLPRYGSDSRERVQSPYSVKLEMLRCVERRGSWRDMDEHAEERLAALESVWYEIIEAVNAGRTSGLVCPECNSPDGLQVEERQGHTLVSCPACKREVEVAIASA